jgi:hypothetical protein
MLANAVTGRGMLTVAEAAGAPIGVAGLTRVGLLCRRGRSRQRLKDVDKPDSTWKVRSGELDHAATGLGATQTGGRHHRQIRGPIPLGIRPSTTSTATGDQMHRKVCTISISTVALLATLTACSGGSGSSGATTDKHRVGHTSGLNYPSHRGPDRNPPGRPSDDLANQDDLTSGKACAKSGHDAKAEVVIRNGTQTTNDYSIGVDFYREGSEYVGQQVASTYAQVYDVAPSEQVTVHTQPLDGEEPKLPDVAVVCRFGSMVRMESIPS